MLEAETALDLEKLNDRNVVTGISYSSDTTILHLQPLSVRYCEINPVN